MAEQILKDSDISRELLRALLHEVVNGIVIADTKGTILSFNPGAEKLFGWHSGDVIGKNVTILMPEPFCSHHAEHLNNYMTTGEKRIIGIGREAPALHRDGSTFPVHLALAEINVKGVRQFVAVITKLTTFEEVKTIINAIRSIVRGGLKRAIRALEESAGKSAVMGEFDKLELALKQTEMYFRISTIPLSFSDVDLRKVIEKNIGDHPGRLKIDGIVYLDGSDSLLASGDVKYLKLVFQTLLENASRHSEDGRAIINVASRDNDVFVSITNKGTIHPERQKYLFDLVPEGVGELSERPFGLSLVNANLVAVRHGGEITCQSSGGKTTFTVRLPLAAPGKEMPVR